MYEPIYQTEQIREFERLAQERYGISGQVMMHRAAKASLDFLLRHFPDAQKISVFCGAGNNGGDGYTLALLANESGLKITIWQVGDHGNLKNEAKAALDACRQAKLHILPCDEQSDIQHPDVIVDAICGIGMKDKVRQDCAVIIEKMHQANVPIFSVDIPTGVDADTGQILGNAVRANATMTFIGLKLGLLTGSGGAHTGDLALCDLQLPQELFSEIQPVAKKITMTPYLSYLKRRAKDWHKGLSGHVLIVGGDYGFSGAPRMAGEAALRVGAGLVSIATRKENALVMNIDRPELMCHGIESTQELNPLLQKADVIVLGPGLGQSDWAKNIWSQVIQQNKPLVIDADGLNLLAITHKSKEDWVLTPHPGEAARLIGSTAAEIQADRLAAVKKINQRYGGVCVLKGAGTLVCSAHFLAGLCDKGNPGMASAGLGDILSGVIGGLIAQGIPIEKAAELGVFVHASAGDEAAQQGERGLIATDLLPYLRKLVNRP